MGDVPETSRATETAGRLRVAVVIVNYRTPQLVIDCLGSLRPELDPSRDCVVIVDNGSGDASAELIEEALAEDRVGGRVRVLRSAENRGFAGGNNLAIACVDAEFYLLLNSDTIVRAGAVGELLRAAERYPRAGLIGPRLERPGGIPSRSTFRYRTPLGEFVEAAATAPITRLFPRHDLHLPISDLPTQPDWISFACVLLRRDVIQEIGALDERYFMYFEDIDYSRRTRAAGWDVLQWPEARVVHLQGASSSTPETIRQRGRPPAYYYASRSRYFAKFHGRAGLWLANLLWLGGFGLSALRALLARKPSPTCEKAWRDVWKNTLHPLEEVSLAPHQR